jgi:hypothetical protein
LAAGRAAGAVCAKTGVPSDNAKRTSASLANLKSFSSVGDGMAFSS